MFNVSFYPQSASILTTTVSCSPPGYSDKVCPSTSSSESHLCILTTGISGSLFASRRCSKLCRHSYHSVSCLPQRLSGKVCYRILHIIYSRRILWDINIQKKKPRILPPRCFLLASSWSMIPPEVVRTTKPNCLEGRRLFVHFSISPMATSNLGEITPHLLRRPVRLTITLPARWSSTTLNIKNIK